MTLAEIAQVVLAEALAARVRERTSLVVGANRIEVVVFDPERDRRVGSDKSVESGHKVFEHKVTLEIRWGVLRVAYPDFDHVSTTRPLFQFDEKAVDDLDAEVVGGMVRVALEAGRTPF